MRLKVIHFVVLGIIVLFIETQTIIKYYDWALYWILLAIASKSCDKYKVINLAVLYSVFILLGLVLENLPLTAENLIYHIFGILILWFITFNFVTLKEQHRKEEKLRKELQKKQKEISDIYDRVDDIVFGLDKEWKVTYKNAAADRYGYNFVNVGDNFFEKMPDLIGTDLELNLKKAMAAQTTQSFLYKTRYSTSPRILSFTVYPSMEGLSIFTKDMTDVISAQNEAIRANEDYNTMIERVNDAFWAVDQNCTIIHANRKMIEWTGKRKEEVMGKNLWEILPLLKGSFIEEKFKEAMETQQTIRFEFKSIYIPETYLAISVHPSEKGLTIFAQDITEYKDTRIKLQQALKERDYFLKELSHRVKNNLQIVASIINLEKENTEDPRSRSSLNDIATRIMSISYLHERLLVYESVSNLNASEYIRDIIQFLSRSYETTDAVISMDLDDIILDVQSTTAVGMIVNELVSNSFKHACGENKRCEVHIKFERIDEYIKLTIKDNGTGYPEILYKKNSFGVELVKHFVEQVDGTITFENKSGAYIELLFPFKNSS